MVEYEERLARPYKKKLISKEKAIKIINTFILYYSEYAKQRGLPEVYVPTPHEVKLCEILSSLPYNIRQWENFIKLYFTYINDIIKEYGGSPSLKHFFEHFNKISYLVGDGE